MALSVEEIAQARVHLLNAKNFLNAVPWDSSAQDALVMTCKNLLSSIDIILKGMERDGHW